MDYLSPQEAGLIDKHATKLVQQGKLSHRAHFMLRIMLWKRRMPGRKRCRISYSSLGRMANLARATVSDALKQLQALNIIVKIKRRLNVRWGDGIASRQDTSEYEFVVPRTEFSGQPVDPGSRGSPTIRKIRATAELPKELETIFNRLQRHITEKEAQEGGMT